MRRIETAKIQASSSREHPSSKLQCSRDAWLKLGVWSFSGVWMLVLGALIIISSSGCRSTHASPSCCAEAEPAAAFSDKSLYQTDSQWTTDAGKQMKLADLKGRPQVVVMFFASCQYACPILVHDLQKIEAALQPDLRARVGFTLVTIDPRRDTPEALANFRATRVLPAATWTLLHGESDDILELAALLGVKYKEEATGQFAHSNIITVLNGEGEIVQQLVGLGQDIKTTVRELEKLLTNQYATAQ
jgi:protein SCO1/2